MATSFQPSEQQLLIMKRLLNRMTVRDIANDLKPKVSGHWVHVQLKILANHGLTKNERPGKALGWVNTSEGLKILKEEGFIEEETDGPGKFQKVANSSSKKS